MKILLLLFLTFRLCDIAYADTIDYWHVYYNKQKIKEFNQYSKKGTIIIQIKNVGSADTLTIRYFRDAACSDCETQVAFVHGRSILIRKGRGAFEPIKISINDFLKFHIRMEEGEYDVFYSEGVLKRPAQGIYLFKIKVE